MRFVPIAGIAGLVFAAGAALAGEKVTVSHALSLVGAPKYGPDFQWLDYVDPNAPKGGDLRLAAIGGYDSLNPYIIKGDAAAGIGFRIRDP